MNKVKALVTSNSKYKIVQHYRNGINLGDSFLFITKMALRGHLLTDESYSSYLEELFHEQDDDTSIYLSLEEVQALLGEQQ